MKLALSVNEKALLRLTAKHSPISRVELAKRSGLTGASVTRITKKLINKGFLLESGKVHGGRGQPSILLQFNPEGAFSFGVTFSQLEVEVVLMNLSGTALMIKTAKLEEASVDNICKNVAELSELCLSESPQCSREKVLGYGIALPGNFSSQPRRLLNHSLFPDLANCNIDKAFSELLPYPCWVENDASAAALGVHQAHPMWTDFCLVHIGYGLGGGVFIDGQLYTGKHGNAGAFGVFFPYDRERPSGQDLFQHMQESNIEVDDFNQLDEVDFSCLPLQIWMERAAKQLSIGALNIARCFDTPKIVIGGHLPTPLVEQLSTRIEMLMDKLRHTDAYYFPGPLPTVTWANKYAVRLGTAWIPIHRFFFD